MFMKWPKIVKPYANSIPAESNPNTEKKTFYGLFENFYVIALTIHARKIGSQWLHVATAIII